MNKIDIYKALQQRLDDLNREMLNYAKEFSKKYSVKQTNKIKPKVHTKQSNKINDKNIKKIYKEIAKQIHPDKTQTPIVEFNELNSWVSNEDYVNIFDTADKLEIQHGINIDTYINKQISRIEDDITKIKKSPLYLYKNGTEDDKIKIILFLKKIGLIE